MAEADVAYIADTLTNTVQPARSLKETRSFIKRIGSKLRRRAARRHRLEELAAQCRDELARLSGNLDSSKEAEELRVLADRVYLFCEEEQEDLERSAGGRTVTFEDGGKFGWRDNPLKIPDEISDEDLIPIIRRARLMGALVTYKPKVDRQRILKDPEIREKLKGIRFDRSTVFRIEPPETDERMEALSGKDRPVWEIKKPRSRTVA
jgi:phage host-nuclease inhibitor protein Gam